MTNQHFCVYLSSCCSNRTILITRRIFFMEHYCIYIWPVGTPCYARNDWTLHEILLCTIWRTNWILHCISGKHNSKNICECLATNAIRVRVYWFRILNMLAHYALHTNVRCNCQIASSVRVKPTYTWPPGNGLPHYVANRRAVISHSRKLYETSRNWVIIWDR